MTPMWAEEIACGMDFQDGLENILDSGTLVMASVRMS